MQGQMQGSVPGDMIVRPSQHLQNQDYLETDVGEFL